MPSSPELPLSARAVPTWCAALLAVLLGCSACAPPAPPPDAAATAAIEAPDVSSFSRPDEVAVEHLALDLTVDFESRRLQGRASLDVVNRGAFERLILDTNGLEVTAVSLDDGAPTTFELGEEAPYLGRPLTIAIRPETKVVHVDYATSPAATALQWLAPAQTAGGEHPYLFSQSQAILARTWVPCQDSPGVRFTYEATLRVPPGLLALMSAENPTEPTADGVYAFRMPQAIPSYLLAIAVGDVAFRALGPRSGVYAEPSVVERAAYEFAETEEMIAAVERLYGPYRWGRYDILVLPPSFPFGGMENPRLTFVTPTILAGDRSLVSLVAHELAHSWSGNLVTNATWNDFWLNEGFTTYLERRVMEEISGREYSEMLALIGRRDLERALERLGPTSPDTRLRIDVAGRDPDDGMTDLAYEKGYLFLRLLEESVGREAFDTFLKSYFDRNAFQSLTTAEFVDQLRSGLFADRPEVAEQVRLEEWIYGPGLPANAPEISSQAFARVEAQAAAFVAGASASELATGEWTSHEWVHFLRSLPGDLSAAQMAEFDAAFSFSSTGNSEVLNAWLEHVIASRYEPGYPALERFLTSMGRRKFLEPLYRQLAATPEGTALARQIYAKARPLYHPLAVNSLDPLLTDG